MNRPTGTTVARVGDVATNVTLLAANGSRAGASIFNDSSAILYVKLGAIATSTDYTVRLASGDFYELPFRYIGQIDGIWASDAGGGCQVTEFV